MQSRPATECCASLLAPVRDLRPARLRALALAPPGMREGTFLSSVAVFVNATSGRPSPLFSMPQPQPQSRAPATPPGTGQGILKEAKHRTLDGYMPGDPAGQSWASGRRSDRMGASPGRGAKGGASSPGRSFSPILRARESPSPRDDARGLALSGSGTYSPRGQPQGEEAQASPRRPHGSGASPGRPARPAGASGISPSASAGAAAGPQGGQPGASHVPVDGSDMFEHMEPEEFAQRLYDAFGVEDPSVVLQEVEKLKSAEADLRGQLRTVQDTYTAQAKTHRMLTRQLVENQKNVDSLKGQTDSLRGELDGLQAWGTELLAMACREARAAGLEPQVAEVAERLALPDSVKGKAESYIPALLAAVRSSASGEDAGSETLSPDALSALSAGQQSFLTVILFTQLLDHASLASSQLRTAQAENRVLLGDLDAARQQQLRLAEENHVQADTIDHLTLKAQAAEDAALQIQTALKGAEEQRDRARAELSGYMEAMARTDEDFRSQKASLEERLSFAEAEVKERETELEAKSGDIRALGERVSSLESSEVALKRELAEAKACLAQAEEALEAARAETLEVSQHRDALSAANDSLSRDLAGLMRNLSSARKSALDLSQSATDAEARCEMQGDEVLRLRRAIETLSAEKESYRSMVSSLEEQVARVNEQYDALEAKLREEGEEQAKEQAEAEAGPELETQGVSGAPGNGEAPPEGALEAGSESKPEGEPEPASPGVPGALSVPDASSTPARPESLFDLAKLIFTCIGQDPAQLTSLASELTARARQIEGGGGDVVAAAATASTAATTATMAPSVDADVQSHGEPSALFDQSFADQALRAVSAQLVDFDVILHDVQRKGRFQPSRSIYASFVK